MEGGPPPVPSKRIAVVRKSAPAPPADEVAPRVASVPIAIAPAPAAAVFDPEIFKKLNEEPVPPPPDHMGCSKTYPSSLVGGGSPGTHYYFR